MSCPKTGRQQLLDWGLPTNTKDMLEEHPEQEKKQKCRRAALPSLTHTV